MHVLLTVVLALLGFISLKSIAIISGGRVIEGLQRGYSSVGAPSNGTSEVQTLTIGGTPSGGTFTLAFEGFTTAAIPWSNVNATLVASIDAALEALPNIGTGGVTTAVGTMTAGVGTITITFAANLAVKAVSTITVVTNAMTGTAPTVAVAETTPGVAPSGQGAAVGAQLVRDNGVVYVNTGTALAPTWTVVGSQT